jgi:hypothetical protein
LLPLCGGNGVVAVPCGVFWLGYAGILLWRTPERPPLWHRLFILGLAGTALLLIPLYFFRLEKAVGHPPSPGLRSALRSSAQFLGISVGPAAAPYWRYSGSLVVGLLLLTGSLLVFVWWGRPRERLRALGLLAMVGAMTALATGVGWGRSGFGEDAALAGRYSTLGVLTLCCIYFTWALYSPRAIGGLVELGLFTGVVLLFALNTQVGSYGGWGLRNTMKAFERDLEAGEPLFRLSKRYAPTLFHHSFTRYMPMAKRAGVGAFRYLQEDPPFQEIPVPLAPATAPQVTWHEGTAQGTGSDSYLGFDLREPRYVAGIRLAYLHSNEAGISPALRLVWKKSGQKDFPIRPSFSDRYLGTGPEPQSAIIWVDESIDQFRLHPDEIPYRFKIEEIVLLVPHTGPPAGATQGEQGQDVADVSHHGTSGRWEPVPGSCGAGSAGDRCWLESLLCPAVVAQAERRRWR